MTNRGICVGGPIDGEKVTDMRDVRIILKWDNTHGTMAEDGYTSHRYHFDYDLDAWVYQPDLTEHVEGGRPAC